MMKGGPKQFPNLAAYVENATKPNPLNAGIFFQGVLAVIGATSFITGVCLLLAAFGSRSWIFLVQEVFPPFGLAVLCALGVVAAQRLVPRRPPPTPLELEAKDVKLLLRKHLRDRRLHKAGPEAVTRLLEEAARQYLRIQSSLSGNFWRSAELPDPYKALRAKARVAADRVMDEMLVMLRPRLSETAKPQHWKDIVDEVAENLGLKSPDRGFVFPSDLEPAAKLAEGLRSLGNDLEQASIRAITEVESATSAESSLRSCLSELQALNVAESELDDSLHFRS